MRIKSVLFYDFDKNNILITGNLDISTKMSLKLRVDICYGMKHARNQQPFLTSLEDSLNAD